MYIIIAILIFGLLITVHEAGHFIAAKSLGVKVNEFALGMGPVIYKRQGSETLFSLRVFPIGGFCAMEGEDEDTGDPRAFTRQALWKRVVILIAGSFMNFLAGFLVIIIILAPNKYYVNNVVANVMDGASFSVEGGVQAGDELYKIDGKRVYLYTDIDTILSRTSNTYHDITVIRGGERVELTSVPMVKQAFEIDGTTKQLYGFNFGTDEASVSLLLKTSWYNAIDFVRMVWMGLSDLVSGGLSINDMSGPVGIVDAINDVGTSASSTSAGISNAVYLGAFIAINLAVMNMLPIPALDGGRIFFLFVTAIIEKIRRKRLDPKYEGYIHMAGLFLLLALSAVIMLNDILKLAGVR